MKVLLEESDGRWHIRTQLGNPVGTRMLSSAPPADVKLPEIPQAGGYGSKMDAHRVAMDWNLYLRAVREARNKRISGRRSRSDEYAG